MRKARFRTAVAVWGAVAVAVATVGAGALQAQGSLTVADYTEIQQLYAKYNMAIDSGDEAGWAGTFTPDGVFGGTTKGTDQLKAFVKGFFTKFKGNARHWNSNLVITPTADGAKGSCYLILMDVTTKAVVTTGIYMDSLVKTPAGWRFKERAVKGDAPPPAATKQN